MNRRKFFTTTGAAALAGTAFSATPKKRLGLTAASYSIRWRKRKEEDATWKTALDFLEHCRVLNAGCLQIGARGWTEDFTGTVRDKRESIGIELEGQIGLPKTDSDIGRFEKELHASKEAGAKILRTVCLGGRRYETFKTLEEWQMFVKQSKQRLERAEPVLKKHKIKLAIENHKDWRAEEFLKLLSHLDSEWMGVTFDFGNNLSLLGDPVTVAEALAPWIMTTHIKDMAMADYGEGFLLSEVPLGKGILDLRRIMDICESKNPRVQFNLEMITRDPLKVPVLNESYFATMENAGAVDLSRTLRRARSGDAAVLPAVSDRGEIDKLNFEEQNVRESFEYARQHLGL